MSRLQRVVDYEAARSREAEDEDELSLGDGALDGLSGSADGPWNEFPYRKLGYLVAALAAFISICVGIYYSFSGWKMYREAAVPHRAHVATSSEIKAGARVVKPFFGPKTMGGEVEDVQLSATIWFREGTPSPPPEWAQYSPDWQWDAAVNRGWGDEEYGQARDHFHYGPEQNRSQTTPNPWKEVFSVVTPSSKVTSSERYSHSVKLPGHVARSLATNPWSRLVATFALLPASPISDNNAQYALSTARNTSDYGSTAPWPVSRSSGSSTGQAQAQLEAFLSGSGVGYDISAVYLDPLRWNDLSEPGIYALNTANETENGRWYSTYITSRTWLILASDYPAYSLDSYEAAMGALRDERAFCRNGTFWRPGMECNRSFKRDGHFENMLERQGTSATNRNSDLRYGSFLTTSLSSAAPKEYVQLPKASAYQNIAPDQAADVSFDWHITYSAISPMQLSLAERIAGRKPYEQFSPIMDPHQAAATADRADRAELLNALVGHKYDINSHPIFRALFTGSGAAARYLAVLFLCLYWFTRRTSTGIALEMLIFQTAISLLHHIVQSLLNFDDVNKVWFAVLCIGFGLLLMKQLVLWSRIEFRLSGWLPSAFRVRGYKHGEAKRSKQMKQHGWKGYLGLFGVAFFILRLQPFLPVLVSASSYEDYELLHPRMDYATGLFYSPWAGILQIHKSMDAIQEAVWLASMVAQIRLNHDNQSFAGQFAIGAYLNLASVVLYDIPSIFSRWLGRSASMSSFALWNLVIIVVSGFMVWQARSLSGVPQTQSV